MLEALAEGGPTRRRYEPATPKLIAKVLGEVPVFSGLSVRRRLAAQAEIAQSHADEPIVRQDFTAAAGFFVLLTGAARVEQWWACPL